MILFSLEEYFGLNISGQCEDIGLTSIKNISDHTLIDILFITFVSIAISTNNPLILKYINIPHTYYPPFVLLSLWSVATTISLLSMGLFGRQQVSYVFKFIHVTFELLHLSYCLLIWNFVTFANFISVLAFIAVFSSLSMPCEVSSEFTELGAVLDTANLVVIILIAKYNATNRRIILAFFLHATYIWAFLLMSYVSLSENAIVAMRIYGFCANSLSVLFMIFAIMYTEDIPRRYKINTEIKSTTIYIDENNTVYASKNIKSILGVVLINLLQGLRAYKFDTESFGSVSFGSMRIKTIQLSKVTIPNCIDLTYISNFFGCLIIVSSYIFFSMYIQIHWALCLFYTFFIPSVILYVLFYMVHNI